MISNFNDFICEDKHDDVGRNILREIESSESKVDVFGGYKLGIRIGDRYISVNKHLGFGRTSSSIFRSNKDSYALVINNVHYEVSKSILKKIWDVLLERANDLKYKH